MDFFFAWNGQRESQLLRYSCDDTRTTDTRAHQSLAHGMMYASVCVLLLCFLSVSRVVEYAREMCTRTRETIGRLIVVVWVLPRDHTVHTHTERWRARIYLYSTNICHINFKMKNVKKVELFFLFSGPLDFGWSIVHRNLWIESIRRRHLLRLLRIERNINRMLDTRNSMN